MTQTEYEQKKRECWEDYKRENLDGEVQWQPVSRYDVFCVAFDRAYALGEQTQTISQEDIDRAAEEYATSLYECGMYDKETPATKEDMEYTFKAGANFALGKQEKDAEDTVIQGWAVRDKCGSLWLYDTRPSREYNYWAVTIDTDGIALPPALLPSVTWQSEPKRARITIEEIEE